MTGPGSALDEIRFTDKPDNRAYIRVRRGKSARRASNEEIETSLNAALEAGYRHIDTAFLYGNEAAIGKVLKKWFDSKKLKREDLFIVTKLPHVGSSFERVEKYLKRSLEALQLSYVDLYLIHGAIGLQERGDEIRPLDEKGNPLLDMKTDHGMEAQVDAGRAKAIGLSNFNARQIKRIWSSARIKPANLQVELNVYFQQRELTAFCKALDITVCAYAPIGSPGLPEGTEPASDIKNLENISRLSVNTSGHLMSVSMARVLITSPLSDPVVVKIAKKHNKTPAQVLIRWIIQRGIVAIPKSKTPSRIKENLQVFDFELDESDMDELYKLDKGPTSRIFSFKCCKVW
uniref:NADP-dependent oxidoreductase domain-containing protein n=1 Tax=Timema poppense TaxID=170557 RepID=A0A7R9DFD1_TIMPO|nr:unnamed protein product [Timema poppensis]